MGTEHKHTRVLHGALLTCTRSSIIRIEICTVYCSYLYAHTTLHLLLPPHRWSFRWLANPKYEQFFLRNHKGSWCREQMMKGELRKKITVPQPETRQSRPFGEGTPCRQPSSRGDFRLRARRPRWPRLHRRSNGKDTSQRSAILLPLVPHGGPRAGLCYPLHLLRSMRQPRRPFAMQRRYERMYGTSTSLEKKKKMCSM